MITRCCGGAGQCWDPGPGSGLEETLATGEHSNRPQRTTWSPPPSSPHSSTRVTWTTKLLLQLISETASQQQTQIRNSVRCSYNTLFIYVTVFTLLVLTHNSVSAN